MKHDLRIGAFILMLIGAVPSYAQSAGPAGLTNGLVTWLQLDEQAGNRAQDVSGTGKSGQFPSGAYWHQWGKVGRCVRLTGYQSLQIPLQWQPASFTVSWWVYADGGTIQDYSQAIGANLDDAWQWGSFMFHTSASGKMYVGTDVGTRLETAGTQEINTFVANKWQHFVFTFERGKAAFYKNGQLIADRTSGMSLPAPWKNLAIGSSVDGRLQATGYYDDFRVYDRALSATEVTQLATGGGIPSVYTPPVAPSDDLGRNWSASRSYDGKGNVIGESKSFTDALGRSTQAQVKSQTTGHVLATQTIYSSGGKPVLSTLAAPTDNSAFSYKTGFLTASGQDYRASNFEDTNANAPAPADQPASPGSVGYYYSTNNTLEPSTAATQYPFSLTEEYGGPLGGVKRAAGPGESFRMGSGRETKGREFPLLNDLDHYLTLRPQFVPGASPATTLRLKGEKSVSVNVDGKESISFSDADGKLLATCLSGSQYPGLTLTAAIHAQPDNSDGLPRYQDLHIPAAGSVSLSVQGSGRIRIVNLVTEAASSYAAPWPVITLQPGFYRIISEQDNQVVSHLARYGEFSYSYYDDAGRVVATVAPKGVSLLAATPGSASSNSRVGTWSFNETTGSSAVDQSGKGLNGTLMNQVSWNSQSGGSVPASPAGGSSLLFNGQADYVRVGDAPALRMNDAFTFEAWIYPTANQNGIIVNKENEYEVARFDDGSIQWAINNTSPGWAWISTGIVAPLNTWSHIGLTYNNGVVTAYLNGNQFGSPYNGSGAINYSAGEFWIGGRQCCSQFFKGAIDEVRMWNTVRTPELGTVTEGSVPFVTRNTYSGVGTLLATESTDEGRTEYVYARDGRIRFSQSALQKQQNRFSYSNYDEVGRVVESGEYQMVNGQGHVFENQLPKVMAYEAENARSNPGIRTNWPGYRGTGFVGDLTAQGTFVEFTVNVPAAGRYPVLIRYAAALSSERTMPVYINWSYKFHASFPSTNSWGNWGFRTIEVDLQAGNNLILLQHDGQSNEGWVNVDYIEVTEPKAPTGTTSVLNLLEERKPTNSLNVAQCTQRNLVWYDEPLQDAEVSGRPQDFVLGAVAKTSNGDNTTWYSYDELGRLTWLVQKQPGLAAKTVDYTYDLTGNVLEVAYQKGQPDAFYHHYEYDADKRLRSVYTSSDGVATNRTLQARYIYYLHGPLKRVEIADRLQGIDYAYTVQGWLKSINNSDKRLDQDSPTANGTLKDLFGMRLDYFNGDYQSRRFTAPNLTGAGLPSTDRYDGTVKANSWQTASATTVHGYVYQYDAKGQLLQSDYGKLTGGSLFERDVTHKFEEGNLSYDIHGNILSLRRHDETGRAVDDFAYQYTASTNKLQAVKQDGNNVLSYEYDVLGQMTRETEAGKGDKYLKYDVTGKVIGVYRDAALASPIATYAYNDRGYRTSKVVYNAQGVSQNTTYYVTDAQGNVLSTYEQKAGSALQLTEIPLYGSGRIGTATRLDDQNGTMEPRYELNDQLGNARVIFRKPTTKKYLATMDIGQANSEEQQFENLTRHQDAVRAYDDTYVTLLSGVAEGPRKRLTVEKGDTVTFSAQALYFGTVIGRPSALRVAPLATTGALIAPIPGQLSSKTGPDGFRAKAGILGRVGLGVSITGIGSKVQQRLAVTSSLPMLLIRYRFYDQNNQLKSEGTKYVSGGPDAWEKLQLGFRVPDAGTLELTTLNQSYEYATYFDHIEVEHTNSTIVQEQHQYAFGSPLTGLNYAVGTKRYRHGYQGQYAEKDEETGYDSFELRLYNSRIGRWMSYDPEGQFNSPYVGMGNNPVSSVDPDGGFAGPGLGAYLRAAWNNTNVLTRGGQIVGFMSKSTLNTIRTVGSASMNSLIGAGLTAARAQGVGSSQQRSKLPKIYFNYDGTSITMRKHDGERWVNDGSWSAASGSFGLQNADRHAVANGGPVPALPSGYFIDISAEVTEAAMDRNNQLLRADGIQTIPEYWSIPWGKHRVRLQPINPSEVPFDRDGNSFYLHDSQKGETHGCIECDSGLFDRLMQLRAQGYHKIKVNINYKKHLNLPDHFQTNGRTQFLKKR